MSHRQDLGPLADIRHIVVLMMENRSFDHMFGYLQTADPPLEVNGLTGTESNTGPDGRTHTVFPFPPGETAFHQAGHPLDDSLDPCHSVECVAVQLAGGNAGFVKSFVEYRHPPAELEGLPMGYYTAEHLPVYDFLARHYCVCDAWHSSVPGDTWPNRLYSLAGRQGPPVAHRFAWLQQFLPARFRSPFRNLPIYDVPCFPRHLRDDDWRWYSHDPATLRAADGNYRHVRSIDRGNFAYVNRREIRLVQQAVDLPFDFGPSFLDDCATGKLPPVSWIDPNFINLRIFDSASNDDHPPSDVRAGQQLVLDIYNALSGSPEWDDTLLVITYDEHGGFYDHVVPPPVEPDGSGYATYGVRVPALVIGPRVRAHVCHELFDHTSLIATILRRFAPDPATAIAGMGSRVARAADLRGVLETGPRQSLPDHTHLLDQAIEWHSDLRRGRMATAKSASPVPGGAGHELVPHEFQREFLSFALEMRRKGLPPGKP